MSALDTNTLLSNALNAIQQQRGWLKNVVFPSAVSVLSGSSNANQIFQLVDNLRASLQVMGSNATVPGLAAYAQTQINQAAYDPVADYNALVAEVNAIIAWVVTNFPKDTGGFAQALTIQPDGSRTPTTFTAAQTAQLVALINTALAQLN